MAIRALSALAGENVPSPADGSAEQGLAHLCKMEMSLTLTGKLVPATSSEESDARSLLLRWNRLWELQGGLMDLGMLGRRGKKTLGVD